MKKTILIFSGLITALLILFKISTYNLIIGNTPTEIIITIIAVVFFSIGIIIHKNTVYKPIPKTSKIDHQKIKELGLSKREYEVLCQITNGLSNKEIADKLFVSENTIKTHVTKVFVKLNAKRRTQAIQIAKELQIIPN